MFQPVQAHSFFLWLLVFASSTLAQSSLPKIEGGALAGDRYRVIVSSDIGGTDPDDFQSMVHLLLYSDVLDLEGLIASPYGPGRKSHILQVIDCYEKDFPRLESHSKNYPSPSFLRSITKQGLIDQAPYQGFSAACEGSDWIIDCAKKQDARPLYILVWGGLEDLAQAIHDAPEILPKLRVYWIGGPNKKWSVNAYQYLVEHHNQLWFIEANDTYRGWFVGGNQQGNGGNSTFVLENISGRGALGDFFASQLGGSIKMGDTPSLAWLLRGNPDDPTKPSWGGQFVPAWQRPFLRLARLPTKDDKLEVFGVLELDLALPASQPDDLRVDIRIENQTLPGQVESGMVRFRFCPKAAKRYQLSLGSNHEQFDGKTAEITVVIPDLNNAHNSKWSVPNWWTDNPSPEFAEGTIMGAKTVSQFRQQYLSDFAERMQRCEEGKTTPSR